MITQETSTGVVIGFELCKLNKDNHSKTADLGSWDKDFRIIKALFDIHNRRYWRLKHTVAPEM
jgi:hypothetical protein